MNCVAELVFGAKIWIYRDPFEGIWFWSGELEVVLFVVLENVGTVDVFV